MRSSLWGIILETIIFAFLFFVLGLFFNSKDPLFLHSHLNYTLLVSVVLTLFYGLSAGLILLILFIIEGYFFYSEFPYLFYIQNFLFILVCGEFNYYWNSKIRGNEEKLRYFKNRLRELGRSFYVLKISHNQLEEKYLTKPYSLRNILYEIETAFQKSKQEALIKLEAVIKNYFKVKDFDLLLVDRKNLEFYTPNLKKKKLATREVELIQNSFEQEEAIFISSEEKDLDNNLLAVIPGFNWDNKPLLVLLVREMEFLDFNQENFMAMFITLSYLAMRIGFVKDTFKDDLCKYCDPRFVKDVYTLSYLGEKYKLNSSLVAILLNPKLENYLKSYKLRLRLLDRIEFLTWQDKKIALILFPFEGKNGALGFVERIKKEGFELKDYQIIPFANSPLTKIKQEVRAFLALL